MPEPVFTCGGCGQSDDHPKHTIAVGFNNVNTEGVMFHAHDDDRDGFIHYHFDCPTPWHTAPGVDGDHHARVASLTGSGVKGDELRARITGGDL